MRNSWLAALVFALAACGGDGDGEPAFVPGASGGDSNGTPRVDSGASPKLASLPEQWSTRSCVTCHGAYGEGSSFGPQLAPVIARYVEVEGSAAAARERLIGYILEPQKVPTLRDGAGFPVPMPSMKKTGGTRDDAEVLADYLLTLTR